MSAEDMEKELAVSSWELRPEDNQSILEEELLAGIEETACLRVSKRELSMWKPHRRRQLMRSRRKGLHYPGLP